MNQHEAATGHRRGTIVGHRRPSYSTASPYFRLYESLAPSSWRLMPWLALGLLDVGLAAYLVRNLWAIWRMWHG